MSSKIKYMVIFSIMAMVFILSPADTAGAKIKSGKWGIEKENMMYWKYDTKTKVLTIEGRGKMFVAKSWAGWRLKAKDAEKVVMKGPIKDIGESCFCNFYSLKSVELPDTVEKIGYAAFEDTRKLKKINLPSKLRKIGGDAFNMSALEEISIPDGVKKINAYSFSCDNLRKVKLGKRTKILKDSAFYGTGKLKHIDLPDSLETIEQFVFGFSGLKTVTIPKNVKEIGDDAFAQTKNLKKMTIKSHKIKKWGKKIFYADEQNITVEVPKVKYKEYEKKIRESGAGENIKVVANRKL